MGIVCLIIVGILLFTGSGCMLISLIIDYEHQTIPPPVPPRIPTDLIQDYIQTDIEEPEPTTAIEDDFFEMDDDLLE